LIVDLSNAALVIPSEVEESLILNLNALR